LEEQYRVEINSYDNIYPQNQLDDIATVMQLIPIQLKGYGHLINDYFFYRINLHQPESSCGSNAAACAAPNRTIQIITENTDLVPTLIHEVIHYQQGYYEPIHLFNSSYCPSALTCSFQEAFTGAAVADGIHYVPGYNPETNSYFSVVLDEGTPERWFLDGQYPDYETTAYFSMEYVTNPQPLRTQYPNIYAFFRQVFRREYHWDCIVIPCQIQFDEIEP